MFEKMTMEQFCDVLASDQPTPGGGAALATIAATACALVEMSANVTIAKLDPNEDNYAYLKREQIWFARAKGCLQRLANDDAAAFRNIMAGFALPKSNETEIAQRKAHLQKCYHRAALVPLDVMNMCRDALARADSRVLPFVNKYVSSDCTIGMDLFRTVIRNSAHNVFANTCLIRDEQLKHTLEKQANDILAIVQRND